MKDGAARYPRLVPKDAPQGGGQADSAAKLSPTLGELAKRTLTNLYNERPTWLGNAHAKLDAAVFAAYGWPADLSDADLLERLLALNLKHSTPPHVDAKES